MRTFPLPRVVAVGVAVLCAATALSGCGPRQPWRSELVSANAAGTSSGNRVSDGGVLSPDGTKVAFRSLADDLGPTDRNGEYDIYLRDLESGTTTLVSANAAGTDGGNDDSQDATFSPDGTKVAFSSRADDLGPTDSNGEIADVYVRDLVAGTTILVSVNAAGTDGGNGASGAPQFSPDGTKVLFSSEADDLGPTDTDGGGDIYVRDLVAGTTALVSVNAAGDSSAGPISGALFSPDGTKVAFASQADDLGPTDTNGKHDVYLRDLVAGTTALVSVDAAGSDSGNHRSVHPLFSADGTTIAFSSQADDLGPTDTNGQPDVYVRDLVAGTTTLVSVNAAGTDSGNDASAPAAFSPEGTTIAFHSEADDLGPRDTNGVVDIYMRDLASGVTTLVTVNAAGTDSAGVELGVDLAFSPDGTQVAFVAKAEDLVDLAPEGLSESNVYVRDLVDETTTLVSADTDGTAGGDGYSSLDTALTPHGPGGVFTPDGRRVVFRTRASNLGPVDRDRLGSSDMADDDVYVATLRGADVSAVTATGAGG